MSVYRDSGTYECVSGLWYSTFRCTWSNLEVLLDVPEVILNLFEFPRCTWSIVEVPDVPEVILDFEYSQIYLK